MLFQWYAMFCYWEYIPLSLARTLFGTTDSHAAGFTRAVLINGQIGGFYNFLAFLAALAIPSVLGARRRAQNSAFANDLRQVRAAAEEYAMENGGFPPDGAAALGPAFDGYLSSALGNGPTPVGGVWDWDYEQFGYKAGVSVYRPTADVGQMQEIDRLVGAVPDEDPAGRNPP